MDTLDSERMPRTRPRVARACDRCRFKKSKCDGVKPDCERCTLDGRPCSYKSRHKLGAPGAVEKQKNLDAEHLLLFREATVKMYKLLTTGQQWTGPEVEEVNGTPNVHRILERLGLLDDDQDNSDGSSSDVETSLVLANMPNSLRFSQPLIAPKPKRTMRMPSLEKGVFPTQESAPVTQHSASSSPELLTAATLKRTFSNDKISPNALQTSNSSVQSLYRPYIAFPLTPPVEPVNISPGYQMDEAVFWQNSTSQKALLGAYDTTFNSVRSGLTMQQHGMTYKHSSSHMSAVCNDHHMQQQQTHWSSTPPELHSVTDDLMVDPHGCPEASFLDWPTGLGGHDFFHGTGYTIDGTFQ